MKVKQQGSQDKTTHAPGAGSDKQHPETPPDANERMKRKDDNVQENPSNQNTG